MKRQKYKLLVMASLLLLLVILIIFFYKQTKIVEIKTYPIRFNVTENQVGINIDRTLDFGAVKRPGQATKQFNVSNNKEYSINIYNEIKDVGNFININPYIVVPPKTNTVINVTVVVDRNAMLGHYEGELIMKVYKGKK